jgi:hypothetical protein
MDPEKSKKTGSQGEKKGTKKNGTDAKGTVIHHQSIINHHFFYPS